METLLPSMPGKYGRLYRFYPKTGEQKHFQRGGFIDLANAELATAQIRAIMDSKGMTHIEITQGQNLKKVIKRLPLVAEPTTLAGPDDMSPALNNAPQGPPPQFPPQQYPQQAQQGQQAQQQYQQHYQPQYQQERPMSAVEQLYYANQEKHLSTSERLIENLQEQLRKAAEEKATVQRDLDKANLALELKDKQNELALREARAEIEANANPAPRGVAGLLAGLPPEAGGAIMQGVMGMLGQLIGGGGGAAAGAAPAQLGPGDGLSPTMQSVVQSVTQIFPDDETAMRVMVSVSRLVKDPILLNQLYALGDAQAAPKPQYAA